MKAIARILLISGLVFAFGGIAYSQTVTWSEDSNNAFSFTLSGTGVQWGPTSVGGITSPSGLWSFAGGGDFGGQLVGGNTNEYEFSFVAGGVGVAFVPTGALDEYPGYGDNFFKTNFPSMIGDGNYLEINQDASASFTGWTGQYQIEYDIPNPPDSSVWTWTMLVFASGPAIDVPEPDPLLLVSFGLLALPILHRRRH